MNETRERLERVGERFAFPEHAFERLLRRRDRKRRNQRIAAGVVGMAVFVAFVAAVWINATGGSFDRTPTPGGTGPTPPAPVTEPTVRPNPDAVGFVGLPLEGASPSTPEAGEVVLEASGRGPACGPRMGAFCSVFVYADGRLIWIADQPLPYGANEHTTGLLEQRLTPEGVELLVSEFTSTGACSSPSDSGPIDCSGAAPLLSFPAISKHVGGEPVGTDPTWGLPASAWEDPEIRAFVPTRFGACFMHAGTYPELYLDLSQARVLAWIPSSAADLLREKGVELPRPGLYEARMPCFALTTEEARELSDRLDEGGIERDEGMRQYMLGYQLVGPSRFPEPVLLIGPILPHGEWSVSGFG